jgi:hypothetical protein
MIRRPRRRTQVDFGYTGPQGIWRLHAFVFNYWWLLLPLFVGLGIFLTLWSYDWDPKCLVAECRRLKP